MRLLSQRALHGLAAYEYHSGGLTWLDHAHAPAWEWIVANCFPLWLAPNLVTLLGLAALAVSYALNWYYSPGFDVPVPWWVAMASALAVFFYVNMDSMDGKQARRTGSSSPLGQLFDHGCDALSVHFLMTGLASSLQIPLGFAHVFGTFGVMASFMLGHWEEYHTGIMMYGDGFFGVLEANYLIVAIHVVTAAAPAGLWQIPFTLPVPGYGPVTTTGAMIAVGVEVVVTIGLCFAQFKRTFQPNACKMTERQKGVKELGTLNALQQTAEFVIVFAVAFAYQVVPGSSPQAMRCCSLAWGLAYAYLSTQVIMAHMCKEPLVVHWWPTAAMGIATVIAHSAAFPVDDIMISSFAVICVGYTLYVIACIREICDYLGISALTIKPKAV